MPAEPLPSLQPPTRTPNLAPEFIRDCEAKPGSDDITHYQRIVRSFSETQRLMREIDETIGDFPLP